MQSPHLGARALACAWMLILATACQFGAEQARPSPRVKSAPSPSPIPAPRPPADAILEDGQVDLPRLEARDHITLTEAVRDQPDQVLALQLYQPWGWVEASRRRWGSGDRRLEATVLATLRDSGAELAYRTWAADTARAPTSATACPETLHGLDRCSYGTGGRRAIVVGRLGTDVFRLSAEGLDLESLGRLQVARLAR